MHSVKVKIFGQSWTGPSLRGTQRCLFQCVGKKGFCCESNGRAGNALNRSRRTISRYRKRALDAGLIVCVLSGKGRGLRNTCFITDLGRKFLAHLSRLYRRNGWDYLGRTRKVLRCGKKCHGHNRSSGALRASSGSLKIKRQRGRPETSAFHGASWCEKNINARVPRFHRKSALEAGVQLGRLRARKEIDGPKLAKLLLSDLLSPCIRSIGSYLNAQLKGNFELDYIKKLFPFLRDHIAPALRCRFPDAVVDLNESVFLFALPEGDRMVVKIKIDLENLRFVEEVCRLKSKLFNLCSSLKIDTLAMASEAADRPGKYIPLRDLDYQESKVRERLLQRYLEEALYDTGMSSEIFYPPLPSAGMMDRVLSKFGPESLAKGLRANLSLRPANDERHAGNRLWKATEGEWVQTRFGMPCEEEKREILELGDVVGIRVEWRDPVAVVVFPQGEEEIISLKPHGALAMCSGIRRIIAEFKETGKVYRSGVFKEFDTPSDGETK